MLPEEDEYRAKIDLINKRIEIENALHEQLRHDLDVYKDDEEQRHRIVMNGLEKDRQKFEKSLQALKNNMIVKNENVLNNLKMAINKAMKNDWCWL